MRRQRRSYRDFLVAGSVVCGHVALVLLFARMRDSEQGRADEAPSMTLISISVRERTPHATPIEPPTGQSTLIIVPPQLTVPPQPRLPQSEFAAPSSTTSTAASAIDWRREGERAAENAIRAQPAPAGKSFEERAAPEQVPKARPFGWDPSPGNAGLSGGLPYVELGKRCVIGLGFFGCAIGELPAPNGELFEGMDDPNRDRSSVPDATP